MGYNRTMRVRLGLAYHLLSKFPQDISLRINFLRSEHEKLQNEKIFSKEESGHMFDKCFCCPFLSAEEKCCERTCKASAKRKIQNYQKRIVSVSGTDMIGGGSFTNLFR